MASRDDLLVRSEGLTISLETPEALKAALEERTLPAITRWNRLEGRPRSVDFDQSIRAEVRDPLWNLSKQWQVGEFAGEDAGSPAGASILIQQARFGQFAPGSHPFGPLDENEPLEMRIERMPVSWAFGERLLSLDLRLALGRRWRKMLTAAGLGTHLPAFVSAYGLQGIDPDDAGDADISAHPSTWQKFEAVAGLIDGGALFLFLDEDDTNRASSGIAGLSGTEAVATDTKGDEFCIWVRGLLSLPAKSADAWLPERLEYAASLTTDESGNPAGTIDETLIASEISDGRVDWYHFDRELPGERPRRQPPAEPPVAFLPTPLEYAGMPNARWWQFEDGNVNFGAIDPASGDIGKLLFLDHVLLYANDWYIFPHRVKVGSNARVRGLSIRNIFGERFWLNAAGSRDSEGWQGWGMFANNALGNPGDVRDYNITVLPAAAKIQDAESNEVQLLIRDEMANQVWAIEKWVQSPDGKVASGSQLALETRRWHQAHVAGTGPELQPTEAALLYQLMNRVPENWIPFVPVHKDGDVRQTKLQRAAMPRLLDGDHGLPARIRPRSALLREGLGSLPRESMFVENEEVPRAGARLVDGFRRTRWYGGRTFVWRGIRKHTGRGEGSSGLAFDQLLPKPVEALPAAEETADNGGSVTIALDPPASLALVAHPDPGGGWNVEILLEALVFAPEHAGDDHVEDECAVRLDLNGVQIATVYDRWHYIPPLLTGVHALSATAIANDGRTLLQGGEPVATSVTIEQGAAPHVHGHGQAAEIVSGAGAPAIALEAHPLPDGGSMLEVSLTNLTLSPLAAGQPHSPGEGHVHLSLDGLKLARLYAPWFRVPPLAIGTHRLKAAAYTNDHRPYHDSDGPVVVEIDIEGIEARPLTLPPPDDDHDDQDDHDDHGPHP
jgi:hypothetical protein